VADRVRTEPLDRIVVEGARRRTGIRQCVIVLDFVFFVLVLFLVLLDVVDVQRRWRLVRRRRRKRLVGNRRDGAGNADQRTVDLEREWREQLELVVLVIELVEQFQRRRRWGRLVATS
jgi:hypothetical protein